MNRKDNIYFYSVQVLFFIARSLIRNTRKPGTLDTGSTINYTQLVKHARHIGILGYPYKHKKTPPPEIWGEVKTKTNENISN